jgi:hypothetical protein
MPDISTIINAHNAEHAPPKIARALRSLLEQDTGAVTREVIQVNDGPPSPGIAEVAKTFAAEFAGRGIDYLFMALEKPSGYMCSPMNAAVGRARGRYLTFLDYDNAYRPRHLGVLHEAFGSGTARPDFTYGRRRYMLDQGFGGEVTLPGGRRIRAPEGDSPLVRWDRSMVTALVKSPMNNFIDTSDFMVTRRAFRTLQQKTGMIWNEGIRRFGDWELAARMAKCGLWGRPVDEVITDYYWSGHNLQFTRSPKEMHGLPGPDRN